MIYNLINFEKNTSSRFEVFQIKNIGKISVSKAKVNCCNEKKKYIVVMLPKYVIKLSRIIIKYRHIEIKHRLRKGSKKYSTM